jgi:hypothetical protein
MDLAAIVRVVLLYAVFSSTGIKRLLGLAVL